MGRYKTVAERMAVSLRRSEAEATGKPLYKSYADIPPGLLSKTACRKINRPVRVGEEPSAYVLSRHWLGYMPLYDRRERGDHQ